MDKKKKTETILNHLKSIMKTSINCYPEMAMAAIYTGCRILYEYNQRYTDHDFEEGVIKIAEVLKKDFSLNLCEYQADNNTVLFYDGFGLDVRGVAKMYLNALYKNGYKIIYVTGESSKGCMPETDALLDIANAEKYYISFRSSYTKWANELVNVILKTRPKAMLYYTTPYDVSGAVAFAIMGGHTDRFLIDLTDHAFWLGVNSNDFFCGSREMSASNQYFERGIPKEKLIKLGVNLIVDEGGSDHSGLPFDITSHSYVFSGGSLYKTLGDKDKYYYRIVDHILGYHPDVFFLYAGDGDRTEINKILEKYPSRAFLIPERKDFYYIIKNCTLYLNTYPMFGGMMMKYSANAGKLPITLKHEKDSDGLLLDQSSRKIEYESYEELIADVDKLLTDHDYLSEREALLKGSIITEERFVKNIKATIEQHKTDYSHRFEQINTEKFKEEYLQRFDIEEVKEKVTRKMNWPLFFFFWWMPAMMMKKVAQKLPRLLRTRVR